MEDTKIMENTILEANGTIHTDENNRIIEFKISRKLHVTKENYPYMLFIKKKEDFIHEGDYMHIFSAMSRLCVFSEKGETI